MSSKEEVRLDHHDHWGCHSSHKLRFPTPIPHPPHTIGLKLNDEFVFMGFKDEDSELKLEARQPKNGNRTVAAVLGGCHSHNMTINLRCY